MSLEVLLIRHGQSEWNASGRWQGQQDPPLTDVGRADARRAASGLGTFDAVMSSPLLRAVETAAALAEGSELPDPARFAQSVAQLLATVAAGKAASS